MSCLLVLIFFLVYSSLFCGIAHLHTYNNSEFHMNLGLYRLEGKVYYSSGCGNQRQFIHRKACLNIESDN